MGRDELSAGALLCHIQCKGDHGIEVVHGVHGEGWVDGIALPAGKADYYAQEEDDANPG